MSKRRTSPTEGDITVEARPCIPIDLVPVPLVELDQRGVIVDCNTAACDLLGTVRQRIVGQRSLTLFGRELLGSHLPQGRQRARMTHGDGTQFSADLVMSSGSEWGAASHRCVVAVMADPRMPNASTSTLCPAIETWSTVAQQIQAMCGEVRCIGVGLIGVEAINKGYSRSTGDAVLAEIQHRLQRVSGEAGTVARIAGNQFVMTIPAGLGAALDVDAMIVRLSSSISCPLGNVRVGVVCGVAAGTAQSALVLLDRVTRATEAALASGLGSVSVADGSSARSVASAHPRLDSCLIDAVAQGSIDVAYQPVVDMDTGAIVLLEALARWRPAEFGDVDPDVFIDAAETTGLIHDLGDRVLALALDAVRDEEAAGRWMGRRMSLNLSALQLEHPDIVGRLTDALARRGLSPDVLQIELTESRLFVDLPAAAAHLLTLQRMGVAVALDDFGSGAANLSYLRDLPASVVKIGRRFVRGVLTSSTDREIVRTIVHLADHLHMTVVAVGVETAAQHHELRRLGVRRAQGQLYALPRDTDLLEPVAMPHERAPVGLPARVERLHATHLLDSPPDDRFESIAAEAAAICSSRLAAVTLIDGGRQWFKARVGTTQTEIPVTGSLCRSAIETGLSIEIADTQQLTGYNGARNADGTFQVRYHASLPLLTSDGLVLGTLCVADFRPRRLTPEQWYQLERLAGRASLLLDLAIAEHELARTIAELDQANDQIIDMTRRTGSVLDRAVDGLVVLDHAGRITLANSRAISLLGAPPDRDATLVDMVDHADRRRLAALLEQGSRSSTKAEIRVRAGAAPSVDISAEPCPGRDGTTDVMLTVRQVQHA